MQRLCTWLKAHLMLLDNVNAVAVGQSHRNVGLQVSGKRVGRDTGIQGVQAPAGLLVLLAAKEEHLAF